MKLFLLICLLASVLAASAERNKRNHLSGEQHHDQLQHQQPEEHEHNKNVATSTKVLSDSGVQESEPTVPVAQTHDVEHKVASNDKLEAGSESAGKPAEDKHPSADVGAEDSHKEVVSSADQVKPETKHAEVKDVPVNVDVKHAEVGDVQKVPEVVIPDKEVAEESKEGVKRVEPRDVAHLFSNYGSATGNFASGFEPKFGSYFGSSVSGEAGPQFQSGFGSFSGSPFDAQTRSAFYPSIKSPFQQQSQFYNPGYQSFGQAAYNPSFGSGFFSTGGSQLSKSAEQGSVGVESLAVKGVESVNVGEVPAHPEAEDKQSAQVPSTVAGLNTDSSATSFQSKFGSTFGAAPSYKASANQFFYSTPFSGASSYTPGFNTFGYNYKYNPTIQPGYSFFSKSAEGSIKPDADKVKLETKIAESNVASGLSKTAFEPFTKSSAEANVAGLTTDNSATSFQSKFGSTFGSSPYFGYQANPSYYANSFTGAPFYNPGYRGYEYNKYNPSYNTYGYNRYNPTVQPGYSFFSNAAKESTEAAEGVKLDALGASKTAASFAAVEDKLSGKTPTNAAGLTSGSSATSFQSKFGSTFGSSPYFGSQANPSYYPNSFNGASFYNPGYRGYEYSTYNPGYNTYAYNRYNPTIQPGYGFLSNAAKESANSADEFKVKTETASTDAAKDTGLTSGSSVSSFQSKTGFTSGSASAPGVLSDSSVYSSPFGPASYNPGYSTFYNTKYSSGYPGYQPGYGYQPGFGGQNGYYGQYNYGRYDGYQGANYPGHLHSFGTHSEYDHSPKGKFASFPYSPFSSVTKTSSAEGKSNFEHHNVDGKDSGTQENFSKIYQSPVVRPTVASFSKSAVAES